MPRGRPVRRARGAGHAQGARLPHACARPHRARRQARRRARAQTSRERAQAEAELGGAPGKGRGRAAQDPRRGVRHSQPQQSARPAAVVRQLGRVRCRQGGRKGGEGVDREAGRSQTTRTGRTVRSLRTWRSWRRTRPMRLTRARTKGAIRTNRPTSPLSPPRTGRPTRPTSATRSASARRVAEARWRRLQGGLGRSLRAHEERDDVPMSVPHEGAAMWARALVGEVCSWGV